MPLDNPNRPDRPDRPGGGGGVGGGNDQQPRLFRSRAIDGNRNFNGQSLWDYMTYGRGLLGILAWRAGVTVPDFDDPSGVAPANTATPARLEYDKWIVDCPDCAARGELRAAFVWLDTPYTMCVGCWNVEIDGLWRPVILPDEGDLEDIEEIVGHRKRAENRHWFPTETVDDLRNENRDQGDFAPPKRVRPPKGGNR